MLDIPSIVIMMVMEFANEKGGYQMRFRKYYAIIAILLMSLLICVGCGNDVSSAGVETYISQIEKWSNENLEQASNYTMYNEVVYLMLDENGNELHRNKGSSEMVVFTIRIK